MGIYKRHRQSQRVNSFFIVVIIFTVVFVFMKYQEAVDKYLSPRLEGFEVHGIDVSHYQSTINWDAVKRDSFRFVFMKATERNDFKDKKFRFNWREAKKSGLARGAYHFYRPSIHSEKQAKNFIRSVVLESGDLPPVLDVEVTDKRDKKTIIKGMKNWIDIIEAHYGVKPIIYCNRYWFKTYVNGHFDDYTVWIAAYTRKNPKLASDRPWHFWQYTDKGRISGVKGNVDMNVFHGTKEQFEALLIP